MTRKGGTIVALGGWKTVPLDLARVVARELAHRRLVQLHPGGVRRGARLARRRALRSPLLVTGVYPLRRRRGSVRRPGLLGGWRRSRRCSSTCRAGRRVEETPRSGEHTAHGSEPHGHSRSRRLLRFAMRRRCSPGPASEIASCERATGQAYRWWSASVAQRRSGRARRRRADLPLRGDHRDGRRGGAFPERQRPRPVRYWAPPSPASRSSAAAP